MNQRETILSDHFEKEYGFRPDEQQIKGFKYVFGAMEEYAGQDFKGYTPKEFEPDDPENPRLLHHHHEPFFNGWITWRGAKKPTAAAVKAIDKMLKYAAQWEARRVKRKKVNHV